MDAITADGTLAAIAARNSPVSTPHATRLAELVRVRYERQVWIIGATAAVIILILGAVFTAKVVRARRKLRDANAQLQDDLVARDLVEAALRDSEARFRALFDSAPQTVVAVDRSGTIIFANQRSREMFGSDSLIGKNIEILVPQSSRPLLALTRNMDAGGNGPLHWNHPR